MRLSIVSTLFGFWLAGIAGCGAAAERDSSLYAGTPYRGTVSAQVLDGSRGKRESGTGVARFVPAGAGRSRLEVSASIRRPNDSGFRIEGVQRGAVWSGRSGNLRLEIDARGNVSGGGVENGHRITINGVATPRDMDLVVQTEKLARGATGPLPAGTRIVFDYDLRRQSVAEAPRLGAVKPAPAQSRSSKKTCKRRVWKMRNVATPGGGMTMTQVPHCLD